MFKRSGVWYTCIRYRGKKVQRSLGVRVGKKADMMLAQAIEAKIRTEVIEGSYFEKPIGHNKTFRDLMERFVKEHAPKVGINTRKGYSTYLKHLSNFFGDTNLMSISPKAISRYKVLRMDKGLKPATINRELSMLSTAFNLAINEWEWIKDNPVSRVTKEKENNQRDKWLTVDEERRLLENAPEWLREIIIFALKTSYSHLNGVG